MHPTYLHSLLQKSMLGLLCLLGLSQMHASPVQTSITIDFLVNQPGQQEINILQTHTGLISHRMNLEAVYISHPIEIPIQQAFPFLTFTPVGEVDNYRKEGFHFNVRFSADGDNWTNWQELPLFHEIKPDDLRYIGEMLYLDSTQHFFEYMIVLSNDAITLPPIRLKKLRLDFFNPNTKDVSDVQGNDLGGKPPVSNIAKNDTDCDCDQPAFSDRVSWNCPDGNTFSGAGSPVMTDVTHMIVHHSAGPNSSSNWGAAVLAIWNLHKNTNGWDDIGYNWLIDPNGVIYEGRGGGNNVRGAHFCGKNTGTMGICFLGNYETASPSEEALTSLESLLAWKSCDAGLDPQGSALHASSGLTLSTISGHQDGCNTLCPGANLYPTLAGRVRANSDSILMACTSVTSINELELVSELNIYPNPTDGQVNLEWISVSSGAIVLELLNYQGQLFYERQLELFAGEQNMQLALPNLQTGMYLLRMRDEKGTLTRKLILR